MNQHYINTLNKIIEEAESRLVHDSYRKDLTLRTIENWKCLLTIKDDLNRLKSK